MNKIVTFSLLLLFGNQTIKAQLFVKDAYVYVGDKSIFVKQEINLSTPGSYIYLRNDSQILQGTTTASSNTGTGAVSVFQEGTSNAFAYNYWCSPVGQSNASAGNSNFGIGQLGVPTTITATSPATILAVSALNGTTTNGALNIAQRWIYTFISSLNYSSWIFNGATPNIAPGLGFTMKGTSGTDATLATTVRAGSAANNNPGSAQRYDFRGKPNDGNITAPVANGNLTLVGNPYPSAIDLQTFLSLAENPNCDGTALFWDQPNGSSTSHLIAAYRGGYQIYNGRNGATTGAPIYAYDGAGTQIGGVISTGNNFDRKFAPVGQGFMIRGTGAGNVTFKNTHRVEQKENGTNSVFNRNSASTKTYPNYPHIPNVAGIDYTQISTAPTPHILINGLLNNVGVRQIALFFMPDALDGYDRADSKSPDAEGTLPFDMYLALNNTEFVHSAKAFAMDKTFQLGFKNNTPASFRLQVSDFVNFNAVDVVYLHDKETNQYFDIKNNSYEFTIPAGVNNTRYEITFQTNLSTPDNSILNSLNVYHNIINKTVTIKNPKNINLKSCSLFDISGKQIFLKDSLGSDIMYEFSTSNISDGVYIVNLLSDNNERFSRKIIVNNSK